MKLTENTTSPLSDAALRQLPGGFAAPTRDSQTTFRQLLTAMSFPGRVVEIAPGEFDHPPQLSTAAAALLTALPDAQTRIWLSDKLRAATVPVSYARFHTDAQLLEPDASGAAQLAWIGLDDRRQHRLAEFAPGTALSPHLSATVMIDLPRFAFDDGAASDAVRMRWRGPGIESTALVSIAGLDAAFWQERQRQQTLFPLGVDLVFTSDHALLALPRTTLVESI